MKNRCLSFLMPAGLALFAAVVPRHAGSEGETVELAAKYVKGEKWYVLSELSSLATVTRLDRNGAVSERKVAMKRVDSIERLHDIVDDGGKLAGMTLSVLRSALSTSVDGSASAEAKTPINGRKIAVVPASGAPASFADGAKEPVPAGDFSTCDEFLWLLPDKPVAKGDTWELPGTELVKLMLKGFEPKTPTAKAACRLEDIVARDSAQIAIIAVSMSAKTEANRDFSWEYESTGGRLEFNITSGRPVRLEVAGKGKIAWKQFDEQKLEIASYTVVIESASLKVSYGTSDFVLPPDKEPE